MNIWDWTSSWASRYHRLVWINYKSTESWKKMRELFAKQGRL